MKFLYFLAPLTALLAGQSTCQQSEVPPLDIIPVVHNAIHQEVRTSIDGELTELLSAWESYAEEPNETRNILILMDEYNKGAVGEECNVLYSFTGGGSGGGPKPPKKGPGKPFPCPEEKSNLTIPRLSVRTSSLILRSPHQEVAFYQDGELVGSTTDIVGKYSGGVVVKSIDTSDLQPGKGEIAFIVENQVVVRFTVEYVDY